MKSLVSSLGLSVLLCLVATPGAQAATHLFASAQNVASVIRYLKNGEPLPNTSAEGLVPNSLLMRQLQENKINSIGLLEFDSQLRDLMFEGALGCAVTGAASTDCRTPLGFSDAITRLFGEIRSRASSDARIYAPHLEILEIEGGLLLVGELHIEKNSRRSLAGTLTLFTHDYKNPGKGTQIGPFGQSMEFDRASGGEAAAEKALMIELICLANQEVSQKLVGTVQSRSCAT